MPFAVCSVPLAPLRKEPAHRSEMVSQLLFGEFVRVLGEDGDFMRVRCVYDDYESWCQITQLWIVNDEEATHTTAYCGSFHAGITVGQEALQIAFGTPLYIENSAHSIFESRQVNYAAAMQEAIEVGDRPSKQSLHNIAYRFLNTGYLWGGKSVFGIDCSGFVQQVFKLCGIRLPRDAYQQAEGGEPVETVEESSVGDLAFFHNKEGRVTHVGLLLEENSIIHASGRVRIDKLTGEGIVTADGVTTHHLHSLRRYW